MKKGILIYNHQTNKYNISFYNGNYCELNVNDIFDCSPELNGWTKVILEYDEEWYLRNIKTNEKIPIWENMFVKK